MKLALLLENFDRIAEAPDAVDRLRRFILALSIRGKLIEQNKKDESATDLLNRIVAEKSQLVDEGRSKKEKDSNQQNTNGPWELPKSWTWVPLGSVIIGHLGGGTPPKNNRAYWDGDIYWASVKDIGKSKYVDETIDKITADGLNNSSSNLIPPGCLIVVTRMGLGKISINRVPIAINQDLRALFLSSYSDINYYFNFFKTHAFEGSGLTVKGIKLPELLSIPFPLAPLEEQHRIVAKVDELMALCDQLEKAQVKRESTRDRLLAASVNQIRNPDAVVTELLSEAKAKQTTGDGLSSWRDADFLENLSRLTNRPEHLKAIRQLVLDLGVSGRLTPSKNRTTDTGRPTFRKLESMITVVRGSSPRPKGDPQYYGGPVPRLLIADITRDGKYVTPKIDSLTEEGAKLSRPMARGSLVLAISGSYGVPAFLAVDACIHDGFIGFRDVSPEIELEYLYLVMLWRKPYFDSVVKDSGLKNLTTRHLKEMKIPIPSLDEQLSIVAKVDQLFELCNQLETQLTISVSDCRRLSEGMLRKLA